jgi:hypothetical protein
MVIVVMPSLATRSEKCKVRVQLARPTVQQALAHWENQLAMHELNEFNVEKSRRIANNKRWWARRLGLFLESTEDDAVLDALTSRHAGADWSDATFTRMLLKSKIGDANRVLSAMLTKQNNDMISIATEDWGQLCQSASQARRSVES